VRQLVIKVLNIIDARCNHEVCINHFKIFKHINIINFKVQNMQFVVLISKSMAPIFLGKL